MPADLNLARRNDNPLEFFNEGGWAFLGSGGADEGSDSGESSAGSAFEPEDSELKAATSSDASSYEDDASASDDGPQSEEEESGGEE